MVQQPIWAIVLCLTVMILLGLAYAPLTTAQTPKRSRGNIARAGLADPERARKLAAAFPRSKRCFWSA